MTTDIRVSYLRRFLQRLWPAAANGILNWNLAGCGRGGEEGAKTMQGVLNPPTRRLPSQDLIHTTELYEHLCA